MTPLHLLLGMCSAWQTQLVGWLLFPSVNPTLSSSPVTWLCESVGRRGWGSVVVTES